MGFNCGLKEPSTQGSFFFLQKKKMDQSIKLEKISLYHLQNQYFHLLYNK